MKEKMKLTELQEALKTMDEVHFTLPNGSFVPRHYHLTEIGLATKTFVDCGGKRHEERKVSLQLWTSVDYNHRLKSNSFLNIIQTSLPLFNGEDLEVEVEYQSDTVGKYHLGFNGNNFELLVTKTDCLATELCGIDAITTKVKTGLADLGQKVESSCTPGGGCC
jgi:hypothetical protein